LGLGELGQRLSPERVTVRLAPAKSSIPIDEPRERLISGGPGVISKK